MVKVTITCTYAANSWIKFLTPSEKWIENNYEWVQFILKQLTLWAFLLELSVEREMEINKEISH